MKKILKKFKLKHFARLMLVVIALCCITTVSAFAYNTYSIDIGYYNTNEYSYESSPITVSYFFNNYENSVAVNVGDSVTIDFPELYSTQTPFAVVDGDFGVYDDGEFTVLLSDIGSSDGYYNMIGIKCLISLSGDTYYMPQIQDLEVNYSNITELIQHNLYFLSDVPSAIDVDVVDITDTIDSENGFLYSLNYLLVPAPPPPPPQESITNVWTGVLTFLTTSISTVTNIFWNGSTLTLLGTLGLIGVTIAIIILIFLRVKDFLKLR